MTIRSHRVLVVLLAVGLLTGVLAGPAVAKAKHRRPVDDGVRTYVALGDSYASGPLIPLQEEPYGCLRSTNNYAKRLAAGIGAVLRDATCSGAETEDMRAEQGVSPEPNPPQLDRLDAAVDVVTLQIGGNDIGFSGIAQSCVRAALEGRRCRDEYQRPDGSDELQTRIDETGPKVLQVLRDIQLRSPAADVLVLGYPGIFRVEGPASCPAMGAGEDDARYLRDVQVALNRMIAEQAATAGARYVDVYGPSAGKTACDLPVLRWVEPIVPVNAAAPIHPNLTGMFAIGDLLEPIASQGLATDERAKRGRRH